MKRVLSLAIVLLCLFVSAAHADAQIEALMVIHSENSDEVAATFDLYEQNENTVAVSSLFPDFAVFLDRKIPAVDAFFYLTPDNCRQTMMFVEQTRDSWIKQQQLQTKTGFFSGELFDDASAEISTTFSADAFSVYLNTFSDMNSDQNPIMFSAAVQFLVSRLEDLRQMVGEEDIQITDKTYDQGKYETILFRNQNSTVLTVSVDHSVENRKKLLISYRNDGKTYFREIEFSFNGKEMNVSSALRSSNQSVFRNNTGNNPLYSESFSLINDNDQNTSFRYIFQSEKLSEPLSILGTICNNQDQTAEIKAELAIPDNQKILQIDVCRNSLNRKALFTDKEEMHIKDQKESAEVNMAVLTSMTSLVAEIIPALPLNYQQFLIALFAEISL